MKLGLGLRQDSLSPVGNRSTLTAEAEKLGLDSIWTSEVAGHDALTTLAWLGRSTTRIRLGTGFCQISARSPSAMAMAAMTLDHLTAGRAFIGLDMAGPEVDEGWFGRPFADPLAVVEEYVSIVRLAMDRGRALKFEGKHFAIPAQSGMGLAKPLKSIVHPLRKRIPIILNGDSYRSRLLACGIADGWLASLCIPGVAVRRFPRTESVGQISSSNASDSFEMIADVPVAINDNLEEAIDSVRLLVADRIGRLVERSVDLPSEELADLGFMDALLKVHEQWRSGNRSQAAAAVPTSLVQLVSLVGSKEKIRDDLNTWAESPVTTLLIDCEIDTLRTMAELTS